MAERILRLLRNHLSEQLNESQFAEYRNTIHELVEFQCSKVVFIAIFFGWTQVYNCLRLHSISHSQFVNYRTSEL